MLCKILNVISRKHFRYSLFVKRIIAIEAQLFTFQAWFDYRMWGSEYRIRLHLLRNVSHSNQAERTNSAIADSVVDGQTIEWEFQKLFDAISDD